MTESVDLSVPNRDAASSGSTLEAARAYLRRGWMPIPVPHRSKNPGFGGWAQLRLTEETLANHFNGRAGNIGVLLGEPSGWLIDVDLDHPLALKLVDQYLPQTPAIFGRPGKPRSHRLYCVTRPAATKKFRSKSAGMLVEFRSTGCQTIFPPSMHESGEPITWETDRADPAVVDPDDLLVAIARLSDAVRVRLGEKAAPRQTPTRASPEPPPRPIPRGKTKEQHYATMALRLELNELSQAQEGGRNDRLNQSAFSLGQLVGAGLLDRSDVEVALQSAAEAIGLPQREAAATIRSGLAAGIAQPRQVRTRQNVETVLERAAPSVADGHVALGEKDPATGRIVLSLKRTLPTAEAFIQQFYTRPEGPTILTYAGPTMVWRDNHYVEVEDEALKKQLQRWLHGALRYVVSRRAGELELVDFESNPATVKAALETVKTHAHVPARVTPPAWLADDPALPPAGEILPCRTLNLHIPTGKVLPATPSLFTTSALDFDYDPGAEVPELWTKFLEQLWGDDLEQVELLQEWFGYCLTVDTSQQKMLLLVGPKRSGKGTIGRILGRLIGLSNVAGPTTGSLAGQFGLQPLIGKSLAIVSDARFKGDHVPTVVERLLCISGEDSLTVDRKFMGSVTMKLPTRFMFLTNELPRMTDVSGALAGRFVILRLTQTFYGREDVGLTEKLAAELPGILLWALAGWKRLHQRGRFVQPKSVEDAVRDMEELSSPVSAFVRERCDIGAGCRAMVDDLYGSWKHWCEQDGRHSATTRQTFGRDLAAAVPGVVRRRGTGQTPFYEGIALKGGHV